MTEDLYKVLGVTENASSADIQEAYRKLAREYHPDKVAHLGSDLQQMAEQKMLAINQAYSVLSNAVKRKEYDTQQKRATTTSSAVVKDPSSSAERKAAPPRQAPRSDARDVMLIETHLYQLKEKIRKETGLGWSDFKQSGFSSAIKVSKTGLGKKEYVLYFKVEMLLESQAFLEFTHQARALDSKDVPGFMGARHTIFVIAFRQMESAKRIEDIFNNYNDEVSKGGKTLRYLVLMDVTKNRVLLPRGKLKDRLVRKILGLMEARK